MPHFNLKGKYILPFILMFCCVRGTAQGKIMRTADNNFKKEKYKVAVDYYNLAYRKDTSKIVALNQVIHCYYKLFEKEEEIDFRLERLKLQNELQTDMVALMQLYRETGQYEKAKIWIDKLEKINPNHPIIVRERRALSIVHSILNDTTRYKVIPTSLNTDDVEFAPEFLNDTTLLYSASNVLSEAEKRNLIKGTTPPLSIYESNIVSKEQITKGTQFLRKINPRHFEGSIGISPDKKSAYVTQITTRKQITDSTSNKKVGKVCLAIQIFKMENGKWKDRGFLDFGDPNSSYGHASVSPDGERIYFSSDRKGSIGGADIWYANKEGDTWGTPINAGDQVNTYKDEMYPYIDSENRMFFSSDGHVGLGMVDIFVSYYTKDHFTVPVNLGAPINSISDDLSLTYSANKEQGYFSSNRKGTKGYFDIYYFEQIKKVSNICGNIYDKETNKIIYNSTTSLVHNKTKIVETQHLDANKQFVFTIDETKEASIRVEKEGYEIGEITIDNTSLVPFKTNKIDIYLNKKAEFNSLLQISY